MCICQPLFAFTENSHQSNQPVPLYSVQGSIQRCNIPLAYAAISQYASLILPVCPNAASAVSPYLHVNPLLPHHTSAVVASALETLTCSNRLIRDLGRAMTSTSDGGSSSARSAHRSWISEATFGGRVQFGQVEMTMPFDPNVVKSTLINCQMEVRVGHDSYGLVNPFASSLSSAVHGCYAPKARKLIKGPGGGEDGGGDGGIDGASSIDSRTLSNVLFTRGVFDSGMHVCIYLLMYWCDFDCTANTKQRFLNRTIACCITMLSEFASELFEASRSHKFPFTSIHMRAMKLPIPLR